MLYKIYQYHLDLIGYFKTNGKIPGQTPNFTGHGHFKDNSLMISRTTYEIPGHVRTLIKHITKGFEFDNLLLLSKPVPRLTLPNRIKVTT